MRKRGDTAQYVAAVLALVEGGLSVPEACASNPEFPAYFTLRKFLQRNPEWKAKFDAAVPEAGQVIIAKFFDRIIENIKAGLPIPDALAKADPRANDAALYKFLNKHEEKKAAIAAAIQERETSANPVKKKWTAADYDRALTAIRSYSGKTVMAILDGVSLPSYSALWAFAKTNHAAMKRLDVVLEIRPRPRKLKVKPQNTNVDRHLELLLQNELYASVSRAVSKRIDPRRRDDVIQRIILGILEGEIALSDLASKSNRRTWLGVAKDDFLESLDEPASGDSERMSRIDMTATETEIIFY